MTFEWWILPRLRSWHFFLAQIFIFLLAQIFIFLFFCTATRLAVLACSARKFLTLMALARAFLAVTLALYAGDDKYAFRARALLALYASTAALAGRRLLLALLLRALLALLR